jgi:DNA repair protein RecO (recombination protein O)
MEPKRDLAIVLRSVAFQERHRIVTAISEHHGLISAMARNSIQSRRFGGSLEPYAASEWLFTEKPGDELCQLQEAQIRRPFEGLRKDFERLAMAGVFNELMLKLAPHKQACSDLFKLHSNALACLDETVEPGADIRLLNAYLAKLLHWSGNQPRLLMCLGCGCELDAVPEGQELTAVIQDAGWVCPMCRATKTRHLSHVEGLEPLRVAPMAIVDFHLALMVPIRQFQAAAKASREDHVGLFKLLESLFIFHIPGFDKQPLKSVRFLNLS